MNRVGVASLCLLCAIAFVNAGCTGKVAATNNPPPVMPSIATQPTNQTVTIGQTATFMVVAAGTAPLSYQWQENGTAISGATSASSTLDHHAASEPDSDGGTDRHVHGGGHRHSTVELPVAEEWHGHQRGDFG